VDAIAGKRSKKKSEKDFLPLIKKSFRDLTFFEFLSIPGLGEEGAMVFPRISNSSSAAITSFSHGMGNKWLLSERLRQVLVMFPGDVTFPGTEFSDGIQGPPASVLRAGGHTRTRSDDIVHGLPDDLGDGHMACPGDSLNLFCLLLGKLYLGSDHAASTDYTYTIMIPNDSEWRGGYQDRSLARRGAPAFPMGKKIKRKGDAMKRAVCFLALILIFLMVGGWGLAQQELIIYPAKGQGPEQMEKDKYECYNWAKQQTGFDPVQLPQASTPPPAKQAPQGGW
jgi:hypothetical protein